MAFQSGPAVQPLGYRPELDGIRAVAVLLVVWHHLGILDVPRLGAGFMGVDVFFVLSGYLITTLLLEERRAAGDVRLGAFYARRALRLLPALALVLVIAGIVVYVSGRDAEIEKFRASVPWVLLYIANWKHIGLGILSHTWSLAIEEQFYLLWPPALLLMLRRRGNERILAYGLLGFAIVLAMISAIWGQVPSRPLSRTGLVVVGTYARAAGLAMGCIVALAPGIAARARDHLVGITAVAGAFVVFVLRRDPSTFHYRIGFVAFATFIAIAIAHIVHAPHGRVARTLRNRPLVAIGRVSYGIYLFHVPVILFLAWEIPSAPVAVKAVAALAAAAALTVWSWFVVERPALRYQERFRRVQMTRESTAE